MKKAQAIARITAIFLTNPIIKTSIIIIPVLWNIIVLNVFGYRLGLVDSAKSMTLAGIVATIVAYTIYAVYLLLSSAYLSKLENLQKNFSSFSKNVLTSIHRLYKEKLDNLQDSFIGHINGKNELRIAYEYDKRISSILRELRKNISELTDISTEKISTALFYQFGNGKWRLLEQNYCDAFGGEETAIAHRHSFAHCLLNGDEDFRMLNDKYKEGVCHKVDGHIKPIYTLNAGTKQTQSMAPLRAEV